MTWHLIASSSVVSTPAQFELDEGFILETNACGVGLGEGNIVHPIAYASRTIDPHNAIMEHPNCLGSALLFRSYILGQDYGLLIMPHVHPYFDLLTFLREAGQ